MAWTQSDTHGGPGGGPFSDDLTQIIRLAGFNIRSGIYVDAIQPIFLRCGGDQVAGEWHGGGGGNEQNVIFADGEAIERVDGRSGSYVDQLTFKTNKKTYGPYGGNGGGPFSEELLTDVGGFFGRSGVYLDQVGFFKPCDED